MSFQKGCGVNDLTYPLTQEQIDNLQNCDLVNPMVGKSHGLSLPDDFNIEEAAYEILKVRLEVLNGKYPVWFIEKYWPYNFDIPNYLPKTLEMNGLSFSNPKGLANIVHMDDPLDFPLSLKKKLTNPKYGGSANVKNWHPRWKQFIETVIDTNEAITDFQKYYIRRIFEAKYFFGLGRPEEVLDFGEIITAYPEGCPTHPSYGQGHATLSQAGLLALHKTLDLSEDDIKDGLYSSYLWGQFRCLAGVHYGIDAIFSILLVGGFDKYVKEEVLLNYKEKVS